LSHVTKEVLVYGRWDFISFLYYLTMGSENKSIQNINTFRRHHAESDPEAEGRPPSKTVQSALFINWRKHMFGPNVWYDKLWRGVSLPINK